MSVMAGELATLAGGFATVEVAPGVWCRWSEESAALRLPAGLSSPASLGVGAPAWRRREHHAGWRLLESLLRELVGPAVPARICLTGNGKPVLADAPGVGISISHCSPMVVAAVGLGWQVGVDTELEPGAPPPEHPGRGPEAGRSDRVRAWTVREACVKATGAGLSGRPWQIPVGTADTGRWHEVRWRYLRHQAPVPLSVAWRAVDNHRASTGTRGSLAS